MYYLCYYLPFHDSVMLAHWQEYELTRLKVKKIQKDILRHPRTLQKDPQNQLTRGDREL